MSKSLLIWPGAGIGLLALVLASTAPAFAGHGQAEGGIVGGIFERAHTSQEQASGPLGPLPTPIEFSSLGAGPTILRALSSVCEAAGLVCASGRTCQCTQGSGTITDGLGSFSSGTYSFILNTDITTSYKNGSSVCFFGSAIVNLFQPDGVRSITLTSSGTSCNLPTLTQGTYCGTFDIVGGTLNFSNAFGAGVLDFGANIAGQNNLFVRGAAGNGP